VKQRVDLALVAALFCLALGARLIPLFASPLPYAIDGFPAAKIAEQIGASGQWTIDPTDVNREDLKVPGTFLVLSAAAQLAALHPLLHAQVIFPILAATIVAPVYLIGVRGTGRRAVGLAAGCFVTTYGSFLFLTSVPMKETLGLVLLPATVLLIHERADPRKRAIAIILLLLLAFVDYLTLLMAVGMAASLVFLAHARSLSLHRFSARGLALDFATIGFPFLVAWNYYSAVDLFYFSQASSTAGLVALLAAGVVLVVLLIRRWKAISPDSTPGFVFPWSILLGGALLAGVLVLGPQSNVFEDTPQVRSQFQAITLAIVFLGGFAFVGYRSIRRTAGYLNDLTVSMLTTPVVLILFGFALNQGTLSFRIIYRSVDFVDLAFALLGGLGLALAFARLRHNRPAGVAMTAAFVVALLVTTPIAYDTPQVFGVETVTTPQEFQALQLIASLGAKKMLSDHRLSTVASLYFGLVSNFRLPLWLRDQTPIRGYDYALVLERWTTVGATMFPGATVVLDQATLDSFLSANRIVQVYGTAGDRTFIVQLSDASS